VKRTNRDLGQRVVGPGADGGRNERRVDRVLLDLVRETASAGEFRENRRRVRDDDRVSVAGRQQIRQHRHEPDNHALLSNLYISPTEMMCSPIDRVK